MDAGGKVPERFAYRPALDGLRALAVIAVMVFHQNHLGGGFLGVDVFFVLSGFLITSLLLIDHAKTGKVVSLNFWRRRIRRLFPPLLVLLGITALYAVTVARPQSLASIRHEAVATLLYVQNYWLLHHPEDFRLPLAHTWSLSIEEQFYLAWPLLLAFLVWVTRRTRWLVLAVLALAVASAALMAHRYSEHLGRSANFSTETRAHELLIGATLGIVLLRRRVSGIVVEIVGGIALVFLIVAAFTAGSHSAALYQGGFFVIALATAAVITAGVSESPSRLRALLSWKPLVWIGLISYGLYLYHFAMYGFVNNQHVITSEPALVTMRFGLTIAVATASYFLIERPIRRGALSRAQTLILAPTAIAVAVVLVFVATSGTAPLITPTELQATAFSQAKDAAPDGVTRVLVTGDPLAASLVSIYTPRYLGEGIQGVVEWASACDALGGAVTVGTSAGPDKPCNYTESYESALKSYAPAVSVLALGPSLVFDRVVDGSPVKVGTAAYRDWLYGRLDALRNTLTSAGATFVLTTVPCMNPSAAGPYGGLAPIEHDPHRIGAANRVLRSYARDRHVQLADLGGFLCEHPDYLHDVQLTPTGAAASWQWLAPSLRDAAARS